MFETTCCGVECLIRVNDWEPYRPAFISGPPEDCYPAEGGCGDWEILDLDGNPAPHLHEKLSPAGERRLEQEVFDYMEGT